MFGRANAHGVGKHCCRAIPPGSAVVPRRQVNLALTTDVVAKEKHITTAKTTLGTSSVPLRRSNCDILFEFVGVCVWQQARSKWKVYLLNY